MSRCTIRGYVEADSTELLEAVKESYTDLAPWMPWAHSAYSEDDSRSWVHATIQGRAANTLFDFAVLDANGRYVGGCGVNQIQKAYACANLGYWIRSSAAGQGLAVAAASLVCDWAFHSTDLERLEILVAVGNDRSKRVAEKLGAVFEGRLRHRIPLRGRSFDALVFSVIRTDWEQANGMI